MTVSISALLRCAAACAIVAAAGATAACDEPGKESTGPSRKLQPTFSNTRTEVFSTTDLAGRTSCVTCHTNQGRNPAQERNLFSDPYTALVNVSSREQQRRDISLARMPQSGPPYFTSGQIPMIRRWMELGAPNY
jgi:hypothetical protein